MEARPYMIMITNALLRQFVFCSIQTSIMKDIINSVINLEAIKQLKADMGDDTGEIIADLISMFQTDGASLVQELINSVQTNSSEVFIRAAHTLKSSAAMLGAQSLSEFCGILEQRGKLEASSAMAAEAEQLNLHFQMANTQLQELQTAHL